MNKIYWAWEYMVGKKFIRNLHKHPNIFRLNEAQSFLEYL